jgi:transposase-like protein
LPETALPDKKLIITSDKRAADILKASSICSELSQFLGNYLTKIKTTNMMEWINKEHKRRSKVVVTFHSRNEY